MNSDVTFMDPTINASIEDYGGIAHRGCLADDRYRREDLALARTWRGSCVPPR
jgi:hypothetical protein